MEKEFAQSDLPVRRKIQKTTPQCNFYEEEKNNIFPQFCDDINQRKNTSPFRNLNFSFFQPYLIHNKWSAKGFVFNTFALISTLCD